MGTGSAKKWWFGSVRFTLGFGSVHFGVHFGFTLGFALGSLIDRLSESDESTEHDMEP